MRWHNTTNFSQLPRLGQLHAVTVVWAAEGTSGCDGARDMILNIQTPWQPGSNAVDSATWLNCMRSWREGAKTCCWREETQAAVAGSKACAGYRLFYDTRWGIAGDSNEENIIPKSSSPCHHFSLFFFCLSCIIMKVPAWSQKYSLLLLIFLNDRADDLIKKIYKYYPHSSANRSDFTLITLEIINVMFRPRDCWVVRSLLIAFGSQSGICKPQGVSHQ